MQFPFGFMLKSKIKPSSLDPGRSWKIIKMSPRDLREAVALWHKTEGMVLRKADTMKYLKLFLRRNPGLSYVARKDRTLLGAVLGGHDGRRGYLYHLAVAPGYRHLGIGTALVTNSLLALRAAGIGISHLFVLRNNKAAQKFWRRIGWSKRTDIFVMSDSS